jgi:hypothetical protein
MGPDLTVGNQSSARNSSLSCRDFGCCERVTSGCVKRITIFVSRNEKHQLTWLRAGVGV